MKCGCNNPDKFVILNEKKMYLCLWGTLLKILDKIVISNRTIIRAVSCSQFAAESEYV